MRTRIARFRRLLLVGLTILFAFMTTAPAFAAPPEFQTVPIDFAFVDENATNQCGFPVQISGSGTLKISTHELQKGGIVEIDRLLHATVTFTNLATHTSYTSLSAGPTIITIQSDGTVSIACVGIFDIITLPGQGLLIKNVGRLVTDGNGAVIFEAGSHPTVTGGNVQGLCTALS